MTFSFVSLFRTAMRHGDAGRAQSGLRAGSWIRGEHSDVSLRPPRMTGAVTDEPAAAPRSRRRLAPRRPA